jgi:hypothetical protein
MANKLNHILHFSFKHRACIRGLSILLLLSTMTSCAPGLLYTDIIRPECKDLRGTKLGTKSARGGSHKIEIPTTRIDLGTEWRSRAIGDIAKANGIEVVYGCDKRTLSILAGLYRKREIIIYGE